MYRFMLRPNEPRTVAFRRDGSFWAAYDVQTRMLMLMNGSQRFESWRATTGARLDVKIASGIPVWLNVIIQPTLTLSKSSIGTTKECKVNNKDARTTLMTDFRHSAGVSIVDFKEVDAGWESAFC